VCCSVLQCVAVCCSVLQCVAVCCSVLQCVAVCCGTVCSVVQLDICIYTSSAVCCSMLWCLLQYVVVLAVWRSVVQCSATWCSVLQCVATASHLKHISNTATTHRYHTPLPHTAHGMYPMAWLRLVASLIFSFKSLLQKRRIKQTIFCKPDL